MEGRRFDDEQAVARFMVMLALGRAQQDGISFDEETSTALVSVMQRGARQIVEDRPETGYRDEDVLRIIERVVFLIDEVEKRGRLSVGVTPWSPDTEDIELTLFKLCPGFWPFC